MTDAILALNAGSSSLKFALFRAESGLSRTSAICEGEIDGLGREARFHVTSGRGDVLVDEPCAGTSSHEDALRVLLAWIEDHDTGYRLRVAGHRVVHGGATFSAPVRIDESVMAALRELVPLAPLHQPHNLAAIAALAKLHPDLVQIACFDTSFHHTQAPVATSFALPRELQDAGVRRYGFHGLSYEYIADVMPEVLGPDLAEGRVVVAHLGNGASLCALSGRRSVATTMGFTALDGLMMGTRCGAIDPGVLLYLLQARNYSPDRLSDLLYRDCGLFGVSGISADMRVLLASGDPRAAAAIDLFVYRIVRELGSLAAALGGLDALIFTAGIGEHAPAIRGRVCAGAAWLGIVLDEAANRRGGPCISASKVSAWVVPTDEDLMLARHAWTMTAQ